LRYENGTDEVRARILRLLRPGIRRAVIAARLDRSNAQKGGYERPARIRFSHVGEIAATPRFANALAQAVKKYDRSVSCVIYTRHPKAAELNPNLFVVNFTVEGPNDARRKFAPQTARLVSSAWDGVLIEDAEINFLEHHIGRIATAQGTGNICPVTASHQETPSCDSARCNRCFAPVDNSIVRLRRGRPESLPTQ